MGINEVESWGEEDDREPEEGDARIYVDLPADVRRKIGMLCEYHGVTIGDVVRDHLGSLADRFAIRIVAVDGAAFSPGTPQFEQGDGLNLVE